MTKRVFSTLFWAFVAGSSIVLYPFGGLAIPIGASIPGRSLGHLGHGPDLIIALAAPVAQLSSATMDIVADKMAGYRVVIVDLALIHIS